MNNLINCTTLWLPSIVSGIAVACIIIGKKTLNRFEDKIIKQEAELKFLSGVLRHMDRSNQAILRGRK